MALTKVTTGTIADDSIQSLKNRNLIINGAMQVAQRATQVTGVTTTSYKTCDRWLAALNSLGTWTFDQSTDAPNGFSNSLKTTCTTANASPAAGAYCLLIYYIEAQNLQHLAFGTADAKSMTVSFWVKSNKTGSASFVIRQNDNSDKMISKSYTINSANTWEYKTISIPADTAGVINNDNGIGFQLDWWLNSGTDYSSGSLQSTWSTFDNTNRNASNLGVGGSVSDYFAITGVQLEVGDVATPFEHESFGQTLAKCQRYFYKTGDIGTSQEWYPGGSTYADYGNFHVQCFNNNEDRAAPSLRWPVALRARPTVTYYPGRSDVSNTSGSITVYNSNTLVTTSAKPSGSVLGLQAYFSGTNNDAAAYTFQVTADAEL
jgi:hypothetical protein